MALGLLQDISIKTVERKELAGGSIQSIFEVEPIERGFGITLGNTFRRICLSHIEGTAVTSVRVEGATHEFSAMPGVLEDVVEIVLNCKSLVFETESYESFNINVNFEGPGEIRGHNLELPAGITLVNPDVLIATITEKRSFILEITARKGRGYVLSDEHSHQGKSLDVIFTDAAFMPIRKFSYRIEPIRIGESSEASSNKYEKLIMDVTSNGAIEPEKALGQAARLLMQKLTPFMNLSGEVMPIIPITAIEATTLVEDKRDDLYDVGIETLNLSVRAYNCLKRANKNTIKDILEMTTDELMGIKNFGKKSAEEVIKIVNDRGLFLSDDPRRNEAKI